MFCSLTSSSGNSMRFTCQMSGTYLDTSVYKQGNTTFETYDPAYDPNYCLVMEAAGSKHDSNVTFVLRLIIIVQLPLSIGK
ncbi:hypothetical protein DPMN_046433 [Dreissena polymorpha]|uniref:Uncharacterized protein n=1 Tax=Dreissena polymorpha TaxID=45954 RepID=A0A9D4D8D9_DREPO|nr:hypothetical protein DPMN_046433 [Dreissena polymorpha]